MNIGRLAEARVRNLAAKKSLTCNKASQDDKGWDFILEFPYGACSDSDLKPPLDQAPTPPKCMIQAKGTRSDDPYRSVKLSNWRQLALNPLPAFFFVQEYEMGVESDTFLIHVGEDYIRKVLKRLREFEAQFDDPDPSKRYLNLNWSSQEPLDGDDTSASFVNRVCTVVGDDLNSYSQSKVELLNSLGYDELSHRFNVTVRIPEQYQDAPQEAIVDFQLGLLSDVDVVEASIFETRFGVELPKKTEIGTGTLEVRESQPEERGILELRLSDNSQSVFIPADFYSVGEELASQIDPKALKVRLDIPFGRVLLHQDRANISLTLPHGDEHASFGDLRRIAKFIGLLQKGSSVADLNPVLSYGDSFTQPIESDYHLPDRWDFWAEVMQKAARVAHHFGIEDVVKPKPDALMEQWETLSHIDDVIGPGGTTLQVKVELFEAHKPGDVFLLPAVFRLTVEELCLVVAVSYRLRVEGLKKEKELYLHDMTAISGSLEFQRLVRPQDEELSDEAHLQDISETFKEDDKVLRWWEEPEVS